MKQQAQGTDTSFGIPRVVQVPFVDLRAQASCVEDIVLPKWREIFQQAAYVLGPHVEVFERQFADLCGVRHAVGVANGTDALILALTAVGVKRGSEVITAANSFVATAEAIIHLGAFPVFVDVDPDTYNIAPAEIERHITERTRAIVPVHLYGQPAEMIQILEIANRHGLPVVEDAAQAHGARCHGRPVGSLGRAACFSFYPAKNLGACGDGGAVVTNDGDIALTARKLRDHGGVRKYQHDLVGYNSRLDALQAVALSAKIPFLEGWNGRRCEIASHYGLLLSNIPGIKVPFVAPGVTHVYHLYVIQVEKGDRDELAAFLSERGIQTGIHYPNTIPATAAFGERTGQWPVAEAAVRKILSLPMHAHLTLEQVERVAETIGEYMKAVV